MATYTDNFNRADGSLGANWTDIVSPGAISSNQFAPASGANNSTAIYTAGTFGNDQFSQATVISAANGNCGVVVRMVEDAPGGYNGDGYSLQCNGDGTAFRIYRIDDGGYTDIGASPYTRTMADGDVLRLEISGTTLTAKINGVTVATVTDATYSSGYAGVNGHYAGASSRLDNWSGGDLGASFTPRILTLGVG